MMYVSFLIMMIFYLLLLMTLIASNHSQTRKGLHMPCITPNGQKGTCQEISSCLSLYQKLVENKLRYLRYAKRSSCGIHKNRRLVCCAENNDFESECGLSGSEIGVRIYGGTFSKENKYPWVVILRYSTQEQFLCAGNLINSQFVLTAAHCINDNLIGVRVGVFDNTNQSKNSLDVMIYNKIIYPNYNREIITYDIALLKIDKDNLFLENIRWICLPENNNLPNEFVVVGYGHTGDKVPTFSKQLELQLPFVQGNECNKHYPIPLNYSNVICAGGVQGRDTCKGDSGGPLMAKGNSSVWHLYGIVSYGHIHCEDGRPGVYTRVSRFLEWIEDEMIKSL